MKCIYTVLILVIPFWFSLSNAQGETKSRHLYESPTQNAIIKNDSLDALNLFLSAAPWIGEEAANYINSFDKFCKTLTSKMPKKERDNFLTYLFAKVHRVYLKQYKINSPLYKTFDRGSYDCVSGTALYALILSRLKIHYTIKETKFHVYLLAHYNNKIHLIESTDPLNGVISDEKEIISRELQYQNQVAKGGENYYIYPLPINEKIDLTNLAGLEYYNQGIVSFNSKNILGALDQFEKAITLYNSPRIQDIFKLGVENLAKEVYYNKSIGLAEKYTYYSTLIKP